MLLYLKHPSKEYFSNRLCLIYSPFPLSSTCSVYNRQAGRVQNIFGTSLTNTKCTFLCMYNVHCNTYFRPKFLYFLQFFWTLCRTENHRLDPMDLNIYNLERNPRL